MLKAADNSTSRYIQACRLRQMCRITCIVNNGVCTATPTDSTSVGPGEGIRVRTSDMYSAIRITAERDIGSEMVLKAMEGMGVGSRVLGSFYNSTHSSYGTPQAKYQ